MDRLTKAELVNGFPVCYPNNCSGLPEFVTKGNPYRNIVERLKAYEDLEEQGKLPKLLCAVGAELWVTTTIKSYSLGLSKKKFLEHPQKKELNLLHYLEMGFCIMRGEGLSVIIILEKKYSSRKKKQKPH